MGGFFLGMLGHVLFREKNFLVGGFSHRHRSKLFCRMGSHPCWGENLSVIGDVFFDLASFNRLFFRTDHPFS
jgi:uncharacterized protein YrrD